MKIKNCVVNMTYFIALELISDVIITEDQICFDSEEAAAEHWPKFNIMAFVIEKEGQTQYFRTSMSGGLGQRIRVKRKGRDYV